MRRRHCHKESDTRAQSSFDCCYTFNTWRPNREHNYTQPEIYERVPSSRASWPTNVSAAGCLLPKHSCLLGFNVGAELKESDWCHLEVDCSNGYEPLLGDPSVPMYLTFIKKCVVHARWKSNSYPQNELSQLLRPSWLHLEAHPTANINDN